jgi:hypothetical protein
MNSGGNPLSLLDALMSESERLQNKIMTTTAPISAMLLSALSVASRRAGKQSRLM